jgi:hypothetical protein
MDPRTMHLWKTEVCRAVRRQFLRGAELAGGAIAFGRPDPAADDDTGRAEAAEPALERLRRHTRPAAHLRLVAVGPRGLDR